MTDSKNYFSDNQLWSENQAGFRKHYSTTDQVFLLKCIVDLFLW